MPSPAILLQLTPSDWKNTEEKRNWNRMQGMWGKRSQQQQQQQQFDDVTDDTVPQRVGLSDYYQSPVFIRLPV